MKIPPTDPSTPSTHTHPAPHIIYAFPPQVTVLDMLDQSRKLSKGESVYAVYPDTTAFYLATVAVAARRGVAGAEPVVAVQFHGDELDQVMMIMTMVVVVVVVVIDDCNRDDDGNVLFYCQPCSLFSPRLTSRVS